MKFVEHQTGRKFDVIYLDYLNLMKAAGVASSVGTYKYVETICKEIISSIAKHFKIPVNSAVQFNRGGQNNSDVQMNDVGESQGIANTVDLLIAMFDNEKLRSMKMASYKVFKNRYGSLDHYGKGIIGIDREKMRYYDVDETAAREVLGSVDTQTREQSIIDELKKENEEKKSEKHSFMKKGIGRAFKK